MSSVQFCLLVPEGLCIVLYTAFWFFSCLLFVLFLHFQDFRDRTGNLKNKERGREKYVFLTGWGKQPLLVLNISPKRWSRAVVVHNFNTSTREEEAASLCCSQPIRLCGWGVWTIQPCDRAARLREAGMPQQDSKC